jgi:hypothetical protein
MVAEHLKDDDIGGVNVDRRGDNVLCVGDELDVIEVEVFELAVVIV